MEVAMSKNTLQVDRNIGDQPVPRTELNFRRGRFRSQSILSTIAYFALSATALAGTVTDVIPWNSIPVHAALTPDGRIMTFGATPQDGQGGFDYILWDPSKGSGTDARIQLPNGVDFNSFCVGGVMDPATGRIILAGGAGDAWSAASATHGVAYDYSTTKLSASLDLRYPRYYASLTTLPDGRLIVTGGVPPYGNQGNASGSAEIFTSGKGWTVLPGTDSSPQKQGDQVTTGNPFWYPHQFPIGNDELFVVAGKYTYRLGYSGQGSYRDVKNVTQSNWGASSTAVMYRPGIFMQIGGGTPGNNFDSNPGSNVATVYDLRAAIANPSQAVTSRDTTMRLKRHFANATVLANGEVLVSGGSEGNNTLVNVANRMEIYDPNTDKWRLDAAIQRPRLYHSIAILMKDGRVMSGGGGAPGPINGHDIEIYTPDYLLDKNGQPAKRPSIIDGPKTALSLGQTFRITADKPIKRATIVKTGVVTHSYNTDQRFFEAAFTASGNSADIVFPNDAVNATPGVYMVFAFDADGVPSVGKFIRLKSPTGDTGYSLPNDMPTSSAAVGTARPASGWAFCAHEGETCPVEGTQQVRYGANGTYKTLTVTSQATCSNGAFGGDPSPNVAKTCEILANSYGKLTTYDPGNAGTSGTSGTSGGTSSTETESTSGTSTSTTSGGAVQLVGQNSGMCLSAPQSNDSGQRILQKTCNASDARQLWNFKTTDGGYNIVNQTTGRCLDVAGISTADGVEMQQWDCWGGKNQAFAFDLTAAWSTMKAAHSGKCVAVPASSKVDGSLIIQWTCYSGSEQLWNAKSVSSSTGTSTSGARQIVGKNSGMCLTAPQSDANGQKVQQKACNASDTRQFWNVKATDGGYNIINQTTGRCLDVSGLSNADGVEIQQWDCWGGKNQAFAIDTNASWSTMKAVHSGKCVAVPASSKIDGSLIIQWACYNGAEQLWSLK
jgi:Ricin-type beta-trefoil lectin domain/Domain of unknown function (DUF1929)